MRPFLCAAFLLAVTVQCSSQTTVTIDPNVALTRISSDTFRIGNAVTELTKTMREFASVFSSNQGLKLSERQERVLFAFEALNRGEARLSTLQLLKIQLVERQVATKRRIAQIDEDLKPENIDRALNGTFDAEGARRTRRIELQAQRSDYSSLLAEIENSITDNDREIADTISFLRRIRGLLFPAVMKELEDF